MQAQFVMIFVVAVFVMAYVSAESYVRKARHRDAVRIARAGRPARPFMPYEEVARPDEKEEERHEPQPVGAR